MKSTLKIGDKVMITKGKYFGKEDKVLAHDKKNNRVRLENFKKQAITTKKGQKEIHGTFHLANLKLIVPKTPKKVENAPATNDENKSTATAEGKNG